MYTVRPYNDHYMVSVFEDGKLPVHQYEVWLKRPFCTCPGYKRTPGMEHKHIAIVNAWINSGSPGFIAIDLIDNKPTIIHTPYEIN